MSEVEVILRENYSKMSEDYNRLRAEHTALDGKYKNTAMVCEDLLRELSNISAAHWDDMTPREFMEWAKSRCKFAIDQAERKLGRAGLYNETILSDKEFEKMKSDTYLHDSLKATLEPLVGPTLIGRSGAEIIEEENAKNVNPYAITDEDPIELQDAPKHIAEAVKRQKMEQKALEALKKQYAEIRESMMPLPCPFCGNSRIMVVSDDVIMIYCICDPNQGGCGARSGAQGCTTPKTAIKRWNKRA